MRNILSLLLGLVSLSTAQIAPSASKLTMDTVAVVGSHVITVRDFLERYELMPWPKKDRPSLVEQTKLDFLHSLIAEKLTAMEAAAQDFSGDSLTNELQRNLERLFVRDEFYKSEIRAKVTYSPEEERIGLSRFPTEIRVAVLGIISPKEGELLYTKVAQSNNKKRTLRTFRDSLYVVIDTVSVTYGFPEKNVEDAVFAMGKDSITPPVQTDAYGWVMFSLINRTVNQANAKFSLQDRLHKVGNVLRDRKEDSIAHRVFASVTAPQRAEADPDIFFRMAGTIYEMLRKDSAQYIAKGLFQFTPTGIPPLREHLRPLLRSPFITMATGPMTVDDVINGLGTNNLVFPVPLDSGTVRAVLNNNIKTVIQNEMLAREGLRKNLQQSANVRHDISVWMDNYRGARLLMSVQDTIRANAPDSLSGPALERYVKERSDEFIGTLADRYGVIVRQDVLRTVSVTTTNMSTWRHIGFGGRIIAVPQTRPQYDWIYESRKRQQINQ